jgi:hypothetical protein
MKYSVEIDFETEKHCLLCPIRHEFDQPMLNYTKEQLDAILFKRKSADRGG